MILFTYDETLLELVPTPRSERVIKRAYRKWKRALRREVSDKCLKMRIIKERRWLP